MKPNAQNDRKKSAPAKNGLEGVHGWLWFFVVVATYLWPFFAVVSCIGLWITRCIKFAPDDPPVIVYYSVCIAGTLFLALLGDGVGHRLRERTPRAVRSAKRWLLMVVGWSFAWLVLSAICGGATNTVAQEAFIRVVGTLVWFAIWFSYFTMSQRVKATYPDVSGK